MATIDKDGFPHVVAMNYFARDGAFYMTSYAKAQTVVNVRRNPRVALMIEADSDARLREARQALGEEAPAHVVPPREGQARHVERQE